MSNTYAIPLSSGTEPAVSYINPSQSVYPPQSVYPAPPVYPSQSVYNPPPMPSSAPTPGTQGFTVTPTGVQTMNPAPPPPPASTTNWGLWIVLIIILLIVVGFIIASACGAWTSGQSSDSGTSGSNGTNTDVCSGCESSGVKCSSTVCTTDCTSVCSSGCSTFCPVTATSASTFVGTGGIVTNGSGSYTGTYQAPNNLGSNAYSGTITTGPGGAAKINVVYNATGVVTTWTLTSGGNAQTVVINTDGSVGQYLNGVPIPGRTLPPISSSLGSTNGNMNGNGSCGRNYSSMNSYCGKCNNYHSSSVRC